MFTWIMNYTFKGILCFEYRSRRGTLGMVTCPDITWSTPTWAGIILNGASWQSTVTWHSWQRLSISHSNTDTCFKCRLSVCGVSAVGVFQFLSTWKLVGSALISNGKFLLLITSQSRWKCFINVLSGLTYFPGRSALITLSSFIVHITCSGSILNLQLDL